MLPRLLITAEQPRTQMPKQTKPSFPGVCVGEAVATHPTMNNVAGQLMSAQEAVNFVTRLQHVAAAIAPPYTPRPAPQPAKEP